MTPREFTASIFVGPNGMFRMMSTRLLGALHRRQRLRRKKIFTGIYINLNPQPCILFFPPEAPHPEIMEDLFVDHPIGGSSNDDHEESATVALHVLKEYTMLGDPMLTLQHYYQKQGHVESLSSAWKQPQFHRVGRGKDSKTYWRFTFQCPLDASVSATSVVASSLLLQTTPSLPPDDMQRLAELSRQWFGDFIISPYDNFVYFGTKKNAKRSAAFGVLWKFFGANGAKEQLASPKRKPIKPNISPRVLSPHSVEKKISKLSKIGWIHKLHRVGIRWVDIQYHEHPGEHTVVLSPSSIFCQMEVREPMLLKVESDPQSSKALARDQAVNRLLSAFAPRENESLSEGPTAADSCVQAWVEKEELLNCDSANLCLHAKVPDWVRWKPSPGEKAIVYRLAISGHLPRFDRLADPVTPIGVVFPHDPALCSEAETFSFRTRFSFKDGDSDLEVQLVDPQEITVDRAELLESFATICSAWKQYGTNCPLETLKTRINPAHRKYHFVPLTARGENPMIVNWDLMARVVANRTEPYLVATRRIDVLHMVLASLAFFFSSRILCLCDQSAILISLGCLLLSFWWIFPKFTYRTEDQAFTNNFLAHSVNKNFPFVPSRHPVTRLTAMSHVLSQEARARKLTEANPQDRDLSEARFTDLYRLRFKTRLKHPSIHLLSAHPANKLSDLNPLSYDEANLDLAPRRMLVPELVHILPMPRDFLFMVGSAERYMIPLETAISHSLKARKLISMTTSIGRRILGTADGLGKKADDESHIHLSTLTELLTQATTIFPTCRYERLEFIGDRVLNHLISLCLFTRNGHLEWDGDEFQDHCIAAKRNDALADGALRAGLSRLVYAGAIRWKEDGATYFIPDSHITNMGESILGAIFLNGSVGGDHQIQTEMMLTGFMERLNLPLPVDPMMVNNDCSNNSWFRGESLCRVNGFSFGGHTLWESRLREVEEAFATTVLERQNLQEKCARLISILVPDNSQELLRSRLLCGIPRLLLEIALFDANLDGSDSLIQDPVDQDRLQVAGMIRDSLFHVGSTALELDICRDLFLLNPSATPSDLHLLLTCAQTHDVLAYILLKNELHTCLFDENLSGQSKILRAVEVADLIGGTQWNENDGWILPGGLSTFHFRLKKLRSIASPFLDGESSCCSVVPRYPGLAAGRLHGNDKKLKMTEIADWQFSFKCICGALVLSLGAEPSWKQILRPMFEEVMLLTADEYREQFADTSSICKNYSRGNTNCLLND